MRNFLLSILSTMPMSGLAVFIYFRIKSKIEKLEEQFDEIKNKNISYTMYDFLKTSGVFYCYGDENYIEVKDAVRNFYFKFCDLLRFLEIEEFEEPSKKGFRKKVKDEEKV